MGVPYDINEHEICEDSENSQAVDDDTTPGPVSLIWYLVT